MKTRSNKIFSNKKKTKRNGKKKSVGNVKRRRKSVRHMRRRRKSGGGKSMRNNRGKNKGNSVRRRRRRRRKSVGHMTRRRKSGGGRFKKGDHVHAKNRTMYLPGIIKKVNDKNKKGTAHDTYDIIFIDGETKKNIQEENIMPLLVKNHINNPRVILHYNDNAIPPSIAKKKHKNNANTTREEASIAYSEERKRLLENMMSESYNAYRNLKDYDKAESKMQSLKSDRAKRGRAIEKNLETSLDDLIDGIYRHLKLKLVQNNKDIGLSLQVSKTVMCD